MITEKRLSAAGQRALTFMGAVKPNVRLVAVETLLAAEAAGHPITVVWGLNPASTPEHSAGTALDLMVYKDRAAGDWVANYLWNNRGRLGLRWIIWRQRIRSTSPGKSSSWRAMADRGNPTANHMDHPHINFQVRDYVPPLGLTVPQANSIPDLKPRPTPSKKSVHELAKEVIAGHWSNGDERVRRLRAAGHDPVAVQAEVRRQLANGASKPQPVPPFPTGLGPNKRSPSAVPLQRQLKRAGLLSAAVSESANYGPKTQQAVAAFHNKHPQFRSAGTTHDPAIGPQGWKFLFANY